MRSFLTYGLISLVGVGALYACGDDSGDGTTPAQGGSGGGGGTAGAGGGAGSAGTAGQGGGGAGGLGGGGAGGAPSFPAATCTGCVQLNVPFSAPSQNALYQVNYPAPGLDFSTAVITWSVQLVGGGDPNLFVHLQVQNGAPSYPGYFAAAQTALTAANFAAGQFVNVTLDMNTVPGVGGGADAGADGGADAGDAGTPAVGPTVFDKRRVEAIQLQIGSGATFAGSQSTAVAVDSLTITNVTGTTGATFNTGVDGLTLNNYAGSPTPVGTPPPAAR
jgi:hypothetical protein